MKNIDISADLRPALGDSFAKLAHAAADFNHARDSTMRRHYLEQLRGEASRIADASVDNLKYSTLTTDEKVTAMSDHRAAGHHILALCDAVEI